MSRPDPLLNLLKDIGFLPLRLPRADVQPLQLLNLDGKKFSLLGDLDEAMNAGTATLPPIKKDIATAGQIQGTRSSTVKASLGVDILGNILGALTGTKLDVSAAFQKAATLTFEFGDVTVSTVSIIALDKFLNVATIDATAKQIKQMLQAGKVGVTTAVARSKKYIVSAQDDRGADIKADVPVIKGIASGNLSVSVTGGTKQKVVFEGPDALTFGVQAAQLRFDQTGAITALDQIAAGTAVLGLKAKPQAKAPGKPRLVSTRSRFVEIA
ncbi:MAG TPA: hypothetical protein VMU45_05000 [Candidatus Eisenbacteria bacterium]|nr:hypothetical protein [Candidatus Eisenbacteria bacterium]